MSAGPRGKGEFSYLASLDCKKTEIYKSYKTGKNAMSYNILEYLRSRNDKSIEKRFRKGI